MVFKWKDHGKLWIHRHIDSFWLHCRRPYWPAFFIVQAHVGLEYKRALQVCSGALATAVFSHHLTRLLSPPHHVNYRCGYSLASLGSLLYYFYASTTSMPAVARPREDRKQKTLETLYPQDSSQNWQKKEMTICLFIRLTFVLLLYSLYASRAGYTHYNEKRKIVQEARTMGIRWVRVGHAPRLNHKPWPQKQPFTATPTVLAESSILYRTPPPSLELESS